MESAEFAGALEALESSSPGVAGVATVEEVAESVASKLARRHDLSDGQWARVEPLLPANGGRGGQWKDHRPLVNGMVWRLKTGCPWRDVPFRYGPWQTVYDRFNRWCADGTLRGVAECLLVELDNAGGLDWDLWNIDGSVVRASRAAGGARRDSVKKKSARAGR